MAYHAWVPIHARSHKEVSAVGKQLKHFDKIDLDGIGDKLGSFLKQVSDLATAKSPPTETGQRSHLLSKFLGVAHGRIQYQPT
jgi:hypothetical protein